MGTVLGIDLGVAKSGVCWIKDNAIVRLKTERTANVLEAISSGATAFGSPTAFVVDAPIDPTAATGFRLIDRVFMRGRFNNNHVGLQPNNPDLLNLGSQLESLREWCSQNGLCYSNSFSGACSGVIRETMPNPALGMLSDPAKLIALKRQLRFRYGRGSNVAPIVVAFECMIGCKSSFFDPIANAPTTWDQLAAITGNFIDEQSDDLIAAMTCATLAWWSSNTSEAGFVAEERGHYVLPPKKAIHPAWLAELETILSSEDFAEVTTNLASLQGVRT